MTSTHTFPTLLSPVKIGKKTVRNRVVLPATLTNYAADHVVTRPWINFLVERARGGAGLLISEIMAVDPDALAHGAIVAGYDRRNETGLKETADRVHEAGAFIVAQLWHPGRQQLWSPVASPKGVSDFPDALSWTVPHVMSTTEIKRVRDEYVNVAIAMHEYGFSGVELHGAHGYLITQFLSPWSNNRTDAYGGSRENRLRFVREVASGIRQACGDDFIIGLKMPGSEGVDGGIGVEEAKAITSDLNAAGLFDYFAYSQGNFSLSLENHVPDMGFKPGHFLDIHKAIRPAARGTPVMAIGRIGTPDQAEEALANGACDLVGMSRALVADAAWANKAARGAAQTIRPSAFDNLCWGEIHAGRPIREAQNPELATDGEATYQATQSPSPKRVAVIGTGPAGIMAALAAAQHGHRVTLIGKSKALGGKLRTEASLPNRQEYTKLIEWWGGQLQESGVALRMGHAINGPADLDEIQPQAIIIATGSHQRPMKGFEPRGHSLFAWARDPQLRSRHGGTVVVMDADQTSATYAAVEELSTNFERVVVITARPRIAEFVNYCSAIGVFRRLYDLGVEIIPSASVVRIQDNVLAWQNVFNQQTKEIHNVDLFLWSTPRQADDSLYRALQDTKLRILLAGDCMSPRNLISAAHEGASRGASI